VLVDVEPGSWAMDVAELPRAVSSRTRAIVASHLHGSLVNMPPLVEFARAHRLAVIEDACQAPGARVAGQIAGSWGDVSTLSFGGSKLLTAGRGGAMLTRNAEIHQRAKVFCDRGNQAFPLSELQAAVLLPQLVTLAAHNEARRASVRRLLGHSAEWAPLIPPGDPLPDSAGSYYKLSWLYRDEAIAGCDVDTFVSALQAEGVPCDRGFRGFAGRSERRCRKVGELPHSLRAAKSTLVLHHPVLLESAESIDALCGAISKVVRGLAQRRTAS
jgi:dTDP-4-amino-4,6-dideoxygalactose transaminase